MPDREVSLQHDPGFEAGREHRAHRSGDDSYNDVAEPQKHLIFFVERARVASDAPALDRPSFDAAAAAFARDLTPGTAVALHGEVGAGKTTFVRAVVAALHGNADAVSSPTFVFRHSYPGHPPIEHVDLYRIDDPAEAADLGLDEAFAPGAITFVEWAERLPDLLPPRAVHVTIDGAGDEPRRVRIARR